MVKSYLDIDLLKAFVAVIEAKSFTVAGQRLHKTQSAISVKLRKLEEQIGHALVHRDPPIRPTALGLTLLSTAHRLIEAHEEALFALAQAAQGQCITVGTSETYAASLLPPVLKAFRGLYPDIQIEISCGHSWDMLEAQTHNGIDLVLATRSPRHGGVTLNRQQLFWVCSADSTAYLEKCLPLAVFPPRCLYRDMALAVLKQTERPARIAYTSSHYDGLMAAIATGDAVTVMPERAIPDGCIKLNRSHGLPALPAIDVALYKGSHLSPMARRLGMAIESHYLGA
ncbi:MAG: LysR family transcriptional regulator [Comamonas sp.]